MLDLKQVAQEVTDLPFKKISRRTALLGALFGGAASISKNASAATAGCECLPAPNCNAICPNGGSPRGDGTQACDCFENPPLPPLHPVAYSGDYNALNNRPNRAGSNTDGGDANNSIRWNGFILRMNHNTSDTWIPVFSGNSVDYVLKSEIASSGTASLPYIGARSFTVNVRVAGSREYDITLSRDAYGRVSDFTAKRYCNCDCGDDGGCFIKANLRTLAGVKSIEEISVGDVIVGPDGEHIVVDVASATLGNRKSVSPKDAPDLMLTEEHIVLAKNGADGVVPVVANKQEYDLTIPVVSEKGTKGQYADSVFSERVHERSDYFDALDLPETTKTYSPIVNEEGWAYTDTGCIVRLAKVL